MNLIAAMAMYAARYTTWWDRRLVRRRPVVSSKLRHHPHCRPAQGAIPLRPPASRPRPRVNAAQRSTIRRRGSAPMVGIWELP